MQRQATPGPSREKAERGIYKRRTLDGERFEIVFTSQGKTYGPLGKYRTLKEARLARAEKIAADARGERVAPSRVRLADYAPTWLDSQTHLRPRTRQVYETNL